MRGTFKFLNSEAVDNLLAGTIRLSSLGWFRHLESTHGPWIGDRLEGAASYHGALCIPPAKRLRVGNIQLSAPRNKSAIVANLELACRHMLVFCFSDGEYSELWHEMCELRREGGGEPYDAALQIVDTRLLAEQIWRGKILELGNDSLSKHFRPWQMQPVKYGTRELELALGAQELEISPFVKSERFRQQRETRIALTPHSNYMLDRIHVRIKNPHAVLRRIDAPANGGSGRRLTAAAPPKADLHAELTGLAREIDEWWKSTGIHLPAAPPAPNPDDATAPDWSGTGPGKCARVFGDRTSKCYWEARIAGFVIGDAGLRSELDDHEFLPITAGVLLREIAKALKTGVPHQQAQPSRTRSSGEWKLVTASPKPELLIGDLMVAPRQRPAGQLADRLEQAEGVRDAVLRDPAVPKIKGNNFALNFGPDDVEILVIRNLAATGLVTLHMEAARKLADQLHQAFKILEQKAPPAERGNK